MILTVTFRGIDPRTGKPAEKEFTDTPTEDIDNIIEESERAFQFFKNVPRHERASFLRCLGDKLLHIREDLIKITDRETAIGSKRLRGELKRTSDQFRSFAELIEKGSYQEAIIDLGDVNRFPSPKPDIRRILIPVGPVAVFGASNFPLAFGVCGGDTVSALAAGCTVLAKGHPSHPETNELLGSTLESAIEENGLPAGTFSLVQGTGEEVGSKIVCHPLIKAAAFTGSRKGGISLHNAAQSRNEPIPFYGEMGSINPVIVTENALREDPISVAMRISGAVLHGSGQLCTKPGLILLEGPSNLDDFIGSLRERMIVCKCQPLLSDRVLNNLEDGLSALMDVEGLEIQRGSYDSGQTSIVFDNTMMVSSSALFRREPLLHEERFGPVTLIVKCTDREDLLRTITTFEGQLTGTVITGKEDDDLSSVVQVLSEKVGRVIMNGIPIGVEVGHAMQHGGPFPATTAPWTTSVGMMSIKRWLRPVAFQNFDQRYLPDDLKDENPAKIMRIVDGKYTRDPLS